MDLANNPGPFFLAGKNYLRVRGERTIPFQTSGLLPIFVNFSSPGSHYKARRHSWINFYLPFL